ncbi:MAG: hypothetical protein Q4G70_13210 [Pseudomonadota bacterium]|nr:hypothetical protein [Pseudomonadota bacterium]
MSQSLMLILIAVGVLVLFILGAFALFAKFYRKVEQGNALIVNTLRSEPEVTFTGRMVYPIIHKAELMDISIKTIEIDRSGNQGLICQDNIRADIKVKFFVRVNQTAEDVLRVAQGIGCERASNHEILEDLFSAKFSEALKTVGKSLDFVELYQARDRFRDKIIEQIGDDLSGYVLEDAAIDYLEQTPLERLDTNNILDAQGIKKITELTAIEHVVTNELRRNEEMQIKKKDVETKEALLELERQQADATARQQREVATVKAREEAETAKIQAEEHTRAELARLQAEQAVAVQNENVLREKEVAENNRKRAVVIEQERVTRAKDLEVVAREKEVTLQRIDADKAVEVQKKAIADVIRERIVVERTVAEQEEAIKEVRAVAEADRTGKAVVITAQAAAEEKLVSEVKAAEAQERRARHKASEEQVLAEARLKVAEKEAEAKKREAEGVEAITAAPGLAQAKVHMADAGARLALMEAEAAGKEKVGRAEAQVIEAQAQAEAVGLRAKMSAEAEGKEKVGQAEALVRTVDAEALAKLGDAEAHNIDVKFNAEARGLKEKFEAMKAMSADTREHEEYRMRLERAHIETLKGIEAQQAIAREQAEVLGTAMQNARIDIVGGQGDYFDSFVRALSVGKGIDAAVNKSQTLQVAFKDQISGERDVVEDLKQVLSAAGQSSGELQSLGLTALLTKIATQGSDAEKEALRTLLGGLRK